MLLLMTMFVAMTGPRLVTLMAKTALLLTVTRLAGAAMVTLYVVTILLFGRFLLEQVQTAALLILEPIFETDFLDCSYGFRPHRSAHQALAAISANLAALGPATCLSRALCT